MPRRITPLVPGEVYHVFNRSIAHQPIFLTKPEYRRFTEIIKFYRFHKPGLRFSFYHRLPESDKQEYLDTLQKTKNLQVLLFSYCLMPNHIHFLMREVIAGGIANFMANLQNSWAKYFNIKHDRIGALFQSMFKAVRIETDEQLLHVSRYIHLNPLTSFIVRDPRDLDTYLWSSYLDYVGKRSSALVETQEILRMFASVSAFKQFTLDQVDYQRTLGAMKHLVFEKPSVST